MNLGVVVRPPTAVVVVPVPKLRRRASSFGDLASRLVLILLQRRGQLLALFLVPRHLAESGYEYSCASKPAGVRSS